MRTTQVSNWLRKVEEIEHQVTSIQEEITKNNGILNGCCSNYSSRYRLSRVVMKKLSEVKQVSDDGGSLERVVMVDSRVKVVEQLPCSSINGQRKALQYLKKMMDLLKDDEIGTIGIWGMGGVGKTALIRNLNNELGSSNEEQIFSVVIWVTVSKDLDLRKVQNQIAERLNLHKIVGESMERMAIRLLDKLKRNKFLLILDDVWERIDFDKLGVPQPEFPCGSKIVLTTRSREVCGEMKTDVDMKVDILGDEEAWGLFSENVGKIVDLDHVKTIAKEVARECCGLPLAIITVGRAMRSKTKVELWKDALRQLQMSSSVPSIKGMEKEVFLPLKWSYDSLEGKNIRPCFLYCCLYPEDFPIEVNELIQCWVAEGLIDEQENLEDSYNRGIILIENLKDCCLLESVKEEGFVKMHDVVRDVAIWIASTFDDGNKFLVRSGMGLRKIPRLKTWESLKRVSFMENNIVMLPDSVSQCSEVSTLLLQGNSFLKMVPQGFLQDFQAVRVLNLSGTGIESLPLSLVHLEEIRALLLRNCIRLTDLPPLGGLTKLQVLDLSSTDIEKLPDEMRELRNLRQLDLSKTFRLINISAGTISGLSSLEVLNMRQSNYRLDISKSDTSRRTTFKELYFLDHLAEIYIKLLDFPIGDLEEFDWMKRLRKFLVSIGEVQYKGFIPFNLNTVVIGHRVLEHQEVGSLLRNANGLVLQSCVGTLSSWFETNAASLTSLKSLAIENCVWQGTAS